MSGLDGQARQRIEEARATRPFDSLSDFCCRTRLPRDAMSNLIRAGALDRFGPRRTLLWRLGELDYRSDEFDLPAPTFKVKLPPLDPLEQTVWEYELMGLSPSNQIVAHSRDALRAAGVRSTWQVKHECAAGQRVRVAGMVVRQWPGTAKGMTFLSLEDETGLLDAAIRPDMYAGVRQTLQAQPLVIADGVVQRASGAVSVLLYDLQPLVREA